MAEAINTLSPPKSKTALAKELGVSRSSLYYLSKLPIKDLKLKMQIELVWQKHPAYGIKRLAMHLKINKKRIRRVMKLFKLKVKRRRKIPFKKGDIKQEPVAIPNLLLRVELTAPNQAWAADFTYLPFYGKFVYLATVIDVLSREIISWSTSTRHDASLVIQALRIAVQKRGATKIFHSDQGSEYRSEQFKAELKKLNIRQSMSQKSSPWQNGFQESFYSNFKLDLGHPEASQSQGELIERIAQTVHYYNRQRIHTALKMPPSLYAEKLKNAH